MKKNIIVKFRDEDHSYVHGQTKFMSVNGFIGNFGFKFDRDYWLVHKALEGVFDKHDFYKMYFKKGFDFKDRKPTPEQLKKSFSPELKKMGLSIDTLIDSISEEWRLSAEMGTKFHSDQEDKAYDDGFILNPFDGKKYIIQEKPRIPKGFDNISNLNFLMNLKDGAYSELVVFSPEHCLAGQGDEIFIETIKNKRYVDVGDHKTNKNLPNDHKKNGTCLFPIDHLNDNTHTKYQVQVSMYAHFLERLGYIPRHVGYYHYKNYDVNTKKVLKLKYLGKECSDMLYIHKENM